MSSSQQRSNRTPSGRDRQQCQVIGKLFASFVQYAHMVKCATPVCDGPVVPVEAPLAQLADTDRAVRVALGDALSREGARRHLPPTSNADIPSVVCMEVTTPSNAIHIQGIARTAASQAGAGSLCCLSSIRNPDNVAHYRMATDQPMTWFPLMPDEYRNCGEADIRRLVPERFLSLFAIDIPAISIETYLVRLVERIVCPPETYICALSLCFRATLRDEVGDGIRADGSRIPLCLRSLHRILLAAIVAAAKHRGDVYYTMNYYADAGGVSRDELIGMESAFVQLLGHNLHVRTSEYVDTLFSLRQYCSILVHTQQEVWAQEAWQILLEDTPIPPMDDLLREVLSQVREEEDDIDKADIAARAQLKSKELPTVCKAAILPPKPIGCSDSITDAPPNATSPTTPTASPLLHNVCSDDQMNAYPQEASSPLSGDVVADVWKATTSAPTATVA